MSSQLASLAGWYILPNLVTGYAQSAFYSIWIRAGEPKPQPGTRVHAIHRRRIHILVILAYLCYTIYEADYQILQQGDFYQHLGVGHGVDDRGLQSRFRRITVTHHPDKITKAEDRAFAEAYYVHLKLCRDVLVDPAKRFAYDRFGPDILAWRHCTTIRDYVMLGVRNLAMYYAGTGSVLVLLGITGYLQQAPFWRYLALASMFTFELHTTTTPTHPFPLTHLLNPLLTFLHHKPYLPYQAISLLRTLVLTFFIALSQIGPLLFAAQTPTDVVSEQQLQRLRHVVVETDREAGRLLELELVPFKSGIGGGGGNRNGSANGSANGGGNAGGNGGGGGRGGNMETELRTALRRFLVDNSVRSDPRVRDAMGRVIERRRQGVPPGAQGA